MAAPKDMRLPVTEAEYARIKTAAKRFAKNHYLGHVDAEDYTQEAALATWRGRRKPKSAMIDYFRSKAPLTRSQFKDDPSIPVQCVLEDWFEELSVDGDPDTLIYMADLYREAKELPPAAWALEFPGISQTKLLEYLEEVRTCLTE